MGAGMHTPTLVGTHQPVVAQSADDYHLLSVIFKRAKNPGDLVVTSAIPSGMEVRQEHSVRRIEKAKA